MQAVALRWEQYVFRKWLRMEDPSELIRLYHTKDPSVDDELRAYCAGELLRRGFHW